MAEPTKGTDEKNKPAGLDDYLNSPRKKQKNYICMAYSRSFNPETASKIQSFLKSKYESHMLAYPRTIEDLTKQFSKKIKLLIIDDEFCELSDAMQIVKMLKMKDRKANVPVLFLTARPEVLVEKYNQFLSVFHEGDDYVDYTRGSIPQILSKVNSGLSKQNRRKSRRYKVDLPISYFSLTQNKDMKGRLIDFSLHGAVLKTAEKDHIFRDLEQIKLHLPLGAADRAEYGDFLKISAKVRRVEIAGDLAAVSFEYISEKQLAVLTSLLMSLVNTQVELIAKSRK